MGQVLEHIFNPAEILQGIFRILKSGVHRYAEHRGIYELVGTFSNEPKERVFEYVAERYFFQ